MQIPFDEEQLKVQAPSLSKEIDDILSKEFQRVSFQNRNKIQEEIHGVSNACPEETPEMVVQSLEGLDKELDAIQEKEIYDKVSPFSYLYTKKYRLMFLRCDLFNAKKAAQRMVNFAEYMFNLYGTMDILERPLRLSDLKKGDRGKEVMESLKSGHSQLLPFRDRSGRKIWASHSDAMLWEFAVRVSCKHTWKNTPTVHLTRRILQEKCIVYLMLAAGDDEETQRKGFVWIMWLLDDGLKLPTQDDLSGKLWLRILGCVAQSPHLYHLYEIFKGHNECLLPYQWELPVCTNVSKILPFSRYSVQ